MNWEVIQIAIKLHKKITHITELIHYAISWIGLSYKTEHSAKTISICFQINISLTIEAL